MSPSFATVQGRVFLITRGGDLKPARLANIYVLSSPTIVSEKLKSTAEQTTKWKKTAEESIAAGRVYDSPHLISGGRAGF
jgi:hypothetical protein